VNNGVFGMSGMVAYPIYEAKLSAETFDSPVICSASSPLLPERLDILFVLDGTALDSGLLSLPLPSIS
jgi:hypothetical protein